MSICHSVSLLHCKLQPGRPTGATLARPPHRGSAGLSRVVANSARAPESAAASAAASATSASGPAAPPPPRAAGGATSAAAAALPPERLRQLRRDGLALKDKIKLGRLGVGVGLAQQVALRWRTSEVARLHCHGKHAVNMKQLVQQLEDATGGVVVHRAGGTVLLYRGDAWRPAAAQQGAALQAATQQGDAPTVQKAAAAQQADAAASPPAAASEGQLGQTADEQAPPPLQQHA